MNTYVFSDNRSLLPELLGGARQLVESTGGKTAAIIVGGDQDAADAISMGADHVYLITQPTDRPLDDAVPTIAEIVTKHEPDLILIGATRRGKAIAARLAAAIDTAAIVDIKGIEPDDGSVKARHMVFGGAAIQVEKSLGNVTVATVGQSQFTPETADPSHSGQVEAVEFVEPAVKVTKIESKPKPVSSVDLSTSKVVVCAGRGFQAKEDLSIAADLADTLDGDVGCTRPLTEGEEPFMEAERYIGVSGKTIKPDLYIGVGVSGQTQHTVGMLESKLVVAIDKNPNAPMFRQCDFGVVGDLYEVVPALTQALRK